MNQDLEADKMGESSVKETFVDDTSMLKTPRARRGNGLYNIRKQRSMPAEDRDKFDGNEDASGYPSSNASLLEILTTFDLPERASPQSPYEESLRMESPRWLDEQFESALQRRRSWRSGFSTPLTPTHDQVYKVPVYSPGKKSPTKMEFPHYWELRHEAIEKTKQKAQLVDVESWAGLADGQYPDRYSSDSKSQDERSDLEDSQLSPNFEDRKHRTTQDFQEYFSNRTRSLGFEDHDFSSLSWIEKQVVMYHYGNTKVMGDRQVGIDAEHGKHENTLRLDDFLKIFNHHRCDNESGLETMQRIAEAWQKYGATTTVARIPSQNTIDSGDQSPLGGEATHPADGSNPELPPSGTDSEDTFTSRTPSRSLRRRPSALWLFPKPSLSNLGAFERQDMQQSSATDLDTLAMRNPRLASKDQLAMRRALSVSSRNSGSTQSIPNHALPQKDGALPYTPTRRPEDSQPSFQSAVSPHLQIVISGGPLPFQSSPLSPNLTKPRSALSVRAVKRLSTMPLAIFNPKASSKGPSFSSSPKRRASSTDLKKLASMTARPERCSPAGLPEPSLNQKHAMGNTPLVLKSAGVAGEKICDAACVPTATPDGLDTGLTTIPEIVDAGPRTEEAQDQQSPVYQDSSLNSGDLYPIESSGDLKSVILVDGRREAEEISANLYYNLTPPLKSCPIPGSPPAIKEHLPTDFIQRQVRFHSRSAAQIRTPLKLLDIGLETHTGFDSSNPNFRLLARTYFWRQNASACDSSCSESTNLDEDVEDRNISMRIPRKSAASTTSTFSAKSSDAGTMIRGAEGGNQDKICWATGDSASTLDQGLTHDKTMTIVVKETVMDLAHSKIQELREITGTIQLYLRPARRNSFTHPRHLRRWHSKNLWCSRCQETCAVCDSTCCVYYGAWKVYKDFNLPLDHRDWAYRLLKEIQQWMPVGSDDSTFMDCTTCHRYVCPNCCGICPKFPCYDRVCKNCKADPWELCDFHVEE